MSVKHLLKNITLIMLILFMGYSCKDDIEPETWYPEDYFPVYPGSWWTYSNGEKYLTSSGYVLHNYADDIASLHETQEAFVPYWNGHYVYGYSISQNSTEFPLKQILHETKNKKWVVGRFAGNDIYRKTISKNISVDIIQYPYNLPENCDTSLIEHIIQIPVDTPYMELLPVDICENSENCDTVFITENNITYPLFFEWTLITSWDSIYYDTLIVCDSVRTYDSVIVVKEYIESLDEDTCWFSKEYFAKNIGLIKREVGNCADTSATLTDFELVKYFINR